MNPLSRRSWYWKFYEQFKKKGPYAENLVLLNGEKIEPALNEPTLFVANHSKPEDMPNIQLSLLGRMIENLDGQRPQRIIRSVAADDVYLDDYAWHDRWKNAAFVIAANLGNQLVLKRVESKARWPKRSGIEAIANTLASGNHVHIYPMGTMTLDGRVDFTKDNTNRTFDQEAYRRVREITPHFRVQGVHYTVDPVTRKTIITLGTSRAAGESFDYLNEIKEATTITPLQILASYLQQRDVPEPTPCEQMRALRRAIGALEREGVRIYRQRDIKHSAWDAVDYAFDVVTGLRDPYLTRIENKDKRMDTQDYLANQIAHMELDESIAQATGGSRE